MPTFHTLSFVVFIFLVSLLNVVSYRYVSKRNTVNIIRSINTIHAISTPQKLPDLSQKEFPQIPEENEFNANYDLVVFGSGPGGEAAAVQASKHGAKVAVIERKAAFGGPTGLTSKAVREATKRIIAAIDQIGGDRRRQIKGLWKRKFPALLSEAAAYQVKETRDRVLNNGIDLFIGEAQIVDTFPIPNQSISGSIVRICRPNGCVEMKTRYVCIATGSRAHKPPFLYNTAPIGSISETSASRIPLDFDTKGSRIITATEMGVIMEVPSSVAIFGGGIIAVEYATVLAKLGVGVSLICKESKFIPFLEPELREALKRKMRRSHVLFVHEDVKDIEVDPVNNAFVKVSLYPPKPAPMSLIQQNSAFANAAAATLNTLPNTMVTTPPTPSATANAANAVAAAVSSTTNTNTNSDKPVRPRLNTLDRKLKVDLFMYTSGRNGNSEGLGLEKVKADIGSYGRIVIDKNHRTTAVSEVYAVGDVIGPPGLASAAQQQARTMADLLFKQSSSSGDKLAIDDENEEDEINDHYDANDNVEQDEFFTSPLSLSSSSINNNPNLVSEDENDVTLFGAVSDASKKLKPGAGVPLTLWSMPEIASVGLSLAQAQAQAKQSQTSSSSSSTSSATTTTSFVEGYAYFKDMARGRLTDMDGFLKIVASKRQGDKKGHKIVGVHIFGEGANELIQLGSVLVNFDATIEQVSRTPFAAVTLCGLFQMACDDAILKINKAVHHSKKKV